MNPELKPWFKNQISIRSQDLTVNTVFGIHGTEDLPARFLSGFIPGFGLAEFLQESGANNPTLRIFIPQQIAETVNHLDPVSSQINRQFGQALLQHFVDNFHPDIFVSFDPDEPLTDTAFDILLQLADLLKNNLHPTIDSMIQRRSQHTSSLKKL